MLIGRKEEIRKLKEAYESEYSEFVAVWRYTAADESGRLF